MLNSQGALRNLRRAHPLSDSIPSRGREKPLPPSVGEGWDGGAKRSGSALAASQSTVRDAAGGHQPHARDLRPNELEPTAQLSLEIREVIAWQHPVEPVAETAVLLL